MEDKTKYDKIIDKYWMDLTEHQKLRFVICRLYILIKNIFVISIIFLSNMFAILFLPGYIDTFVFCILIVSTTILVIYFIYDLIISNRLMENALKKVVEGNK